MVSKRISGEIIRVIIENRTINIEENEIYQSFRKFKGSINFDYLSQRGFFDCDREILNNLLNFMMLGLDNCTDLNQICIGFNFMFVTNFNDSVYLIPSNVIDIEENTKITETSADNNKKDIDEISKNKFNMFKIFIKGVGLIKMLPYLGGFTGIVLVGSSCLGIYKLIPSTGFNLISITKKEEDDTIYKAIVALIRSWSNK